jgi:hypothetical protein
MSIVKIDHHPPRRQLTVFGLIWLVFFGIVAVVIWSRGGPQLLALAAGAVAVIVPLVGLISPRFPRIVYVATAYVAFPVGFVVSYLLLAAAYYLVLTPTGLVMRAFGHDPLHRRFDPDAASYWVARKPTQDTDGYFRQSCPRR